MLHRSIKPGDKRLGCISLRPATLLGPPLPQRRGRQWVEPRLYVRAQHLGSGNRMRHATIRELVE